MDLLKQLKFVSGAVSNSAFMTEMNHLAIENGHIRATNGVISMGCPAEFPVNCAPNAPAMRKALENCDDVISLAMTANDRLLVKSGKFKAYVPCVDMAALPHPKPSGMIVDYNGELLRDAFEQLQPFVSKDTLRPWANGILLRGPSAFATNNACLAEYWVGAAPPHAVNIPLLTVKEVLRIKESPAKVMLDQHSITFMYEDGRWIKSQVIDTDWPNVEAILNVTSDPVPVPPDLFTAVKSVMGFTSESKAVQFREGAVRSGGHNEEGASYEVEGLPAEGVYRADLLMLLEGVAVNADFSRYPSPAMFFGGRVRGALSGMTR